jgi:hypothetical protein
MAIWKRRRNFHPQDRREQLIQYEFAQPQTIRSLTIVTEGVDFITAMVAGISNPEKSLESSDDGQNFRLVVKVPEGGAPEHTLSPVTARFFRVTFKRTPPPPVPAGRAASIPESLGIRSDRLRRTMKSARWAASGSASTASKRKPRSRPCPMSISSQPLRSRRRTVAKSDVIDLTSKMRPDGRLTDASSRQWVVPALVIHCWELPTIPRPLEATGLEVDKLNSGYVKNYMDGYLDSYKQTVGADYMGKRGIRYVITDSWEAGSQNWTDDMMAQFKKRRGYDPAPWMPVLTGRVVESAEASDQFLWDFRKTISDLIAGEHYGQVQASLKERGIGHYSESHESGRAFVADGMEVTKLAEGPMSAMWTQVPGVNKEQYGYNADDRESASVAHIYGQNLAAAESLTAGAAPWAWSPATLKPTADQELLNGINRFVIHESAHQPLIDKAPGLTLGPFGQWFNRNETWAEQAGAWIDYLARSSYLLQQGRFAADIIDFYGEDSNITAIFDQKSPDVPAGYGFDYINADGLIPELSAADGRITTNSGMNYRVLALIRTASTCHCRAALQTGRAG